MQLETKIQRCYNKMTFVVLFYILSNIIPTVVVIHGIYDFVKAAFIYFCFNCIIINVIISDIGCPICRDYQEFIVCLAWQYLSFISGTATRTPFSKISRNFYWPIFESVGVASLRKLVRHFRIPWWSIGKSKKMCHLMFSIDRDVFYIRFPCNPQGWMIIKVLYNVWHFKHFNQSSILWFSP